MLNRRRHAGAPESSALLRVQDPRRRIIDAFVQTAAHEGYEHMRLERMLALAEVPEPVFAEHFESKRDCMLAALDELIDWVESAISARAGGSAPWSEQMRLGLEALLCELARNPDGARVLLVECLGAGETPITRLRRAIARAIPILEQGLSGVEAGGESHLPPQISEAIAGGIVSILHRRVLERRTAELPSLLPDLLYFALLPYLGHERTLAVSDRARASTLADCA